MDERPTKRQKTEEEEAYEKNDFRSLKHLQTEYTSPALQFKVVARWRKARASVLTLPHSTINTPVFMPVGTQGTVKGLTTEELQKIGCGIILGNTYHLGHRPGGEILEELGGLHKFMNWNRSILTDSGGFQMVSLLKLSQMTEVCLKIKKVFNIWRLK